MKKKTSKHSSAVKGATWSADAATGDWNTAANWSDGAVPTKTATFGASKEHDVTFAADSEATVGAIAFEGSAPGFTFTFAAPAPSGPALTLDGDGIAHASGSPQRFVVASSAASCEQPQLKFARSASAGNARTFYDVGPASAAAAGGGVIGFHDTSGAGSASFTVTTGAGTPAKESTVGGEVSFHDQASAQHARFTIYGSTSTTDGDTFGNAVFHDDAQAGHARFTNIGGTVSEGDGGNTQFYDDADAAHGWFHNEGGSVAKANGGDVAFDGTASAGHGQFHNYAATADGAYGGVTSFNNNPPALAKLTAGASAGRGHFTNYGATEAGAGGGHTSFSAKYGACTADHGTFVNEGSAVAGEASQAGHTVFSISLPQKSAWVPDAGKATFWNHPGTAEGAPGGSTQFTVYTDKGSKATVKNGPSAAKGTFHNLGATTEGALGGRTLFGGTGTAAKGTLVAYGGSHGGEGGSIVFADASTGGTATVRLHGNGTLDVSGHALPSLAVGDLETSGGHVKTRLGTDVTTVVVSGRLVLDGAPLVFDFVAGKGFAAGNTYTILKAKSVKKLAADRFSGSSLGGSKPTFTVEGDELRVTFAK